MGSFYLLSKRRLSSVIWYFFFVIELLESNLLIYWATGRFKWFTQHRDVDWTLCAPFWIKKKKLFMRSFDLKWRSQLLPYLLFWSETESTSFIETAEVLAVVMLLPPTVFAFMLIERWVDFFCSSTYIEFTVLTSSLFNIRSMYILGIILHLHDFWTQHRIHT